MTPAQLRRLRLLALLLLAGCGTTPGVEADAGADAGLQPDAGPGTDAGTDAGVDGGMDEGPFEWPVPTGPIAITPSPYWKNRITGARDPFVGGVLWTGGWVKFTVLMRDPTKVYFQDSKKYPFHADFALAHLDPFKAMTREQFEAVSLHAQGQEAITGAVLFPPQLKVKELGIQLVRQDAYRKEMVKIVFDLVKAGIDDIATQTPFYMPTFEQEASTRKNTPWLEMNGVKVSSPDRWSDGAVCYAPGWTAGRLVRVAPAAIEAAYKNGSLKSTDVLLTDGVPAELPPLAGVISTRPATPSSHVAILANTLGIPFVYTPLEVDQALLASLEGKKIFLDTLRINDSDGCALDAFALDPAMPPALEAELLALKKPSPIDLVPKANRGAFSLGTDSLLPVDTRYVGGKAAHFGIVRRALPNNAYPAIALTFDLWDDAMSQPVAGGKTLGQEIATRLAAHKTYPPADLFALKEVLDGVRKLIRDQAKLSPAAEAAFKASLAPFDATKKIRFRSSTNVEDAADFTGAGLYDSYSGCLLDDGDADSAGPSLCDANEPEERGVLRALRRVYASFYNDNAYLERIRHGVDETKVGMGVLVHHSVPDDIEQANGVITYDSSTGSFHNLKIVTQLGAQSVTNPEGEAQPEVVNTSSFSTTVSIDKQRGSSLVPLGAFVMVNPTDYETLTKLVIQVATEFRKTSGTGPLALDLEFKKIAPGKLYVKQVRQLPKAPITQVVPFVLNRPQRQCTMQGEYSTVMANHRLKARLSLTTRNVRLTTAERASTVLAASGLSIPDGDGRVTLNGAPSVWPGASHSVSGDQLRDGFITGGRTYTLSAELPQTIPSTRAPVISRLPLYLTVTYPTPQPNLSYTAIDTITEESVRLAGCEDDVVVDDSYSLQTRAFSGPQGLSLTTKYRWPPPPTGISAGYTAPLVKWEGTTISGLTTQPLALTEPLAQTYRPEHHNFSEGFLFDPAKDAATTAAQKTELMTKDVKWLLVSGSSMSTVSNWYAVGSDGALRKLQ